MAETAHEYREELLRELDGKKFLNEAKAAFIEKHELPYASTPAIAEGLQDKIDTANALSEYCYQLSIVVRDFEVE